MTRTPLVDAHGVEHRHGCPLPGWANPRPAVRGWHLATCTGCGTVRMLKADR